MRSLYPEVMRLSIVITMEKSMKVKDREIDKIKETPCSRHFIQ